MRKGMELEVPKKTAKPASILIVDDEEGVVTALRSMFRRDGYRLHVFLNGIRALEFLHEEDVDIIISDLRMPILSGIEFLNKAGGLCPRATRIMLSGYEDKTVVLNALAKGLAQHYVMKPWDDLEFKALIAQTIQQMLGAGHQQMKEIFGGLQTLPSAPRLHNDLSEVLARRDAPVKAIVDEIAKSPPVVAKLLQVANSVYYSARAPVVSIREAVQFIGTEHLENLVMGIEAFQIVGACSDPWATDKVDQLWREAIARATIAKTIAAQWPDFHEKHAVHVATLLQDIGLVVRVCTSPDRYKSFLEILEVPESDVLDADGRTFGMTHDEVGAILLRYWNLPAHIVDAVAKHHESDTGSELITIIQLADVLAGGAYAIKPSAALEALAANWKKVLHKEPLDSGAHT